MNIFIKKYKNRKLYNVNASHYVTLEDIIALVKQNHIVTVHDYNLNDITNRTLMSCLRLIEDAREPKSIITLTELIKKY